MTEVQYEIQQYESQDWLQSLDYTNEWNARALFAVMANLGIPATFLDVGCGNGHLVALMHRLLGSLGVATLASGMELLRDERLPPAISIFAVDLRHEADIGRQYQLVISWEVGEHLPLEAADTYCATLARHVTWGGFLVFTAAAVDQGGDHHINEHTQEYWREKLEALGLMYLPSETVHIQEAWRWATGPCFWLSQNVQVFRRP